MEDACSCHNSSRTRGSSRDLDSRVSEPGIRTSITLRASFRWILSSSYLCTSGLMASAQELQGTWDTYGSIIDSFGNGQKRAQLVIIDRCTILHSLFEYQSKRVEISDEHNVIHPRPAAQIPECGVAGMIRGALENAEYELFNTHQRVASKNFRRVSGRTFYHQMQWSRKF